MSGRGCSASPNRTVVPSPICSDALGGTLARDHQSRAMFFEGKHRRTYVTYLGDDFNARMTYYDHTSKAWAESVVIDDCIAEEGWCKGHKDGHNTPNLWISRSGTIHVLYGSHGTPFKYARSVEPESIDQWELGTRLSNFATYPYFTELPDGEMLLFYRYGPTGGYVDPFLGLQRSRDEGRTWTPVQKLGAFRKACKFNGTSAVFDPTSGGVYFNLALIRDEGWEMYPCLYDPAEDKMYAWDGRTELGNMPGDDTIVEHCRVEGLSLQELFVHDGVLYLLLKRGDGYAFAVWDGKTLERSDIPQAKTKGFTNGPLWTADGRRIHLFGPRVTDPPTEYSGHDLYVWTSEDGGKSWDDGRCLVDRRELGHGLQWANLVMNYPGDGPLLILLEAVGKLPEDFEDSFETHYDNPWRKNKRLYALDARQIE